MREERQRQRDCQVARKLMRAANGAALGLARTITSVSDAVTSLARSAVSNLGEDSDLRLDVTEDGEAFVYCAACWEREFGEEP